MRIQCVSGASCSASNYLKPQKTVSPTFGFWQPAMETKLISRAKPLDFSYLPAPRKPRVKPKDSTHTAEVYMAMQNVTRDFKPKDGVWLRGWAASDIDTTQLDSYRRKYISVHDSDEKVLRTICSKNHGEVVYKQDEYADGRLITRIISKGADGKNKTVIIREHLD